MLHAGHASRWLRVDSSSEILAESSAESSVCTYDSEPLHLSSKSFGFARTLGGENYSERLSSPFSKSPGESFCAAYDSESA